MSVQPVFNSNGDAIADALHRLTLSQSKPQELGKIIDREMAFWISYIMAKQSVTSKSDIQTYLMQRIKRAGGGSPKNMYRKGKAKRQSTSARYLELRDSLAATLVWVTNYKKARTLDSKAFFGLVERYIRRRMYSGGHHKAGFRPGLKTFKVRGGLAEASGTPDYKKVRSKAEAAHPVGDSVTASATNLAGGVEKNPRGGDAAVKSSEAEVVVRLEKLIVKNLREAAERAGLNVA